MLTTDQRAINATSIFVLYLYSPDPGSGFKKKEKKGKKKTREGSSDWFMIHQSLR